MGRTTEVHREPGGAPQAGVGTQFRTNLEALRAAQKPSRGTAAYSRLVNRPAGRLVAAAVHVVGVTPNGATAISATLSAAGLVLLATLEPSWWLGVAVAMLLAGGYVLDSVDGQLARLRGSGSLSGEYLDHAVDCVKTATLHLAVLISWYRFPPVEDPAWLLVPVAFLVVDMMSFFGLVTMPLLRRLHGTPTGASGATATAEHPLRMWVILPTDYGTFCWMFLLLAWPPLFLAGYTAMFLVNTAVMVPVLAKWWRELRAMDRTGARP
jgi:phosphatidylglycerophosphate synthase